MSKPQKTFGSNLLKIATIISTTVSCFRLCFWGILAPKIAIGVIFAVTIFLAIGNTASKIALAIFGLVLFMLVFGAKSPVGLANFITGISLIIIILLGMYFILKKIFNS